MVSLAHQGRRIVLPRALPGRVGDLKLLAMLLLLIVAAAPLPLAGNRPFFWGVWTCLCGLAAMIFALQMMLGRRIMPLRAAWFGVPTLAYVGVMAFLVAQMVPFGGTTISIAPGETLLMLTRWLGFGILFYLAAQLGTDRPRTELALRVLCAVVVGYALLGLLDLTLLGDTVLGLPKWAYAGYATATFVNRNSYATFLAFGLSIATAQFALSLAQSAKSGFWARLRATAPGLCAGLILFGALLATGSRTGLFAGLVGAAAVALLAGAGTRARGAGLAVMLLAAMLAIVLFGGGLLDRFANFSGDASSRLDLYSQVVRMIMSRPWTGFGGGSFELAFPSFHQLPLEVDVVWDKAHSSYLTLFVELGLVVGALVVGLVAVVVFVATQRLRSDAGADLTSLSAAGVAIVATLHSLVDFSLEIQADAYLFIFVLGLAFGRSAWRARARIRETKPASVTERVHG
jgi:O-antigen ligase